LEAGDVRQSVCRLAETDNDLCKPVIPGEDVQAIPRDVGLRVFQHEGPGPKPKVVLDLEHLQVLDYAAFEGLTERQRRQIADLHAVNPIRPEEMVFLALNRSFSSSGPSQPANTISATPRTITQP
jgi:hypothetical protein